MKNMDESFDARLVERLRNYSEEPRTELWKKIAATTEASRRPFLNGKKIILGWSVFILGVITVGGLFYFEQKNRPPVRSEVVSNAISSQHSNKVDDVDPAPPTNQNAMWDATDQAFEEVTTAPTAAAVHIQSNRNQPFANAEVPASDAPALSHDEKENEEDFVADVTDHVNERANGENLDIEKTVRTEPIAKASDKIPNDDEGKTVIKEKEEKRHKFGIYFTIMPTFGYQRIDPKSNDDILVESVKKVSAFSTDRLGVRAELGVEHPLTRRIKAFGGLVYYQRKQTIDYTEEEIRYLGMTEGPNGAPVVLTDTISSEESFEYELKNLGVQLGFSYELSRKKFLQTIGTGFEFHMALNKLESSPTTPELTNNPSAYVFYNLYYRLQYPAEGKLKAVFQPTLNYSFYINQNLNAPFYVKPYGLGINLGFTYNF